MTRRPAPTSRAAVGAALALALAGGGCLDDWTEPAVLLAERAAPGAHDCGDTAGLEGDPVVARLCVDVMIAEGRAFQVVTSPMSADGGHAVGWATAAPGFVRLDVDWTVSQIPFVPDEFDVTWTACVRLTSVSPCSAGQLWRDLCLRCVP
ncbi:MAG: hypothetical protein IPL61_37470 [Myxococcales bacterium]|nr:hypothetical protein [Myxococcales bacterium]